MRLSRKSASVGVEGTDTVPDNRPVATIEGSAGLDQALAHCINPLIQHAQGSHSRHLGRFYAESSYEQRRHEPDAIDLTFGNPHEMPPDGLIALLQEAAIPKRANWFSYLRHHEPARQAIASTLSEEFQATVTPGHIAMTNGAFAGLMTCLRTVCTPGSEVIYFTPGWFYYEAMILAAGASPVAVPADPRTWQLDLNLLEASLSERTSAVIINTPNNPTGAIYSDETLQALSAILSKASNRIGRPIYVLSDESYKRIVFDDNTSASIVAHYPWSFLIYTLTKTLLMPGERIGYLALSPHMPDAGEMSEAITVTQLMTGWAFPNNTLQYALADLETWSVDVGPIQRRRDLMVKGLRELGFEVTQSAGTFYLLVRSPDHDDWAYCEMLAEVGLLVLPGCVMGAPGYFRISLTAPDDQLHSALERLKCFGLPSPEIDQSNAR